jgi:biopolymer transport protein ExbD
MQATAASKKKLVTDINMVPFIDVVLVLLVIFMIVSPFIAQSEIKVNLPQTVKSAAVKEDAPIKVQVTERGAYYIGNKPVAKNDLIKSLNAALALNPNRAVLIEADRSVDFESVVAVLDAAEQLKAAKVGVAVKDIAQ